MTYKYIEINQYLYEVNEKGEGLLVRSTDSTRRAFLRFNNKTSRPVDIWWRDFRGAKHHYICLEPNCSYDINSYVTHPWEFTDVATKERYVINNIPVYRAPSNIGDMLYRTSWNITISVRTLKDTAMLKLASLIRTPCCARALGLPQVLENELEELVKVLQRPESPSIEREV